MPLQGVVPLPGEGRLRLVRGYFRVGGAVSALGTVLLLVLWIRTFGARDSFTVGRALRALAGSALLAAGCFTTARLLDRRRKAGGWLAIAYFGAAIIGSLFGAVRGLPVIAVAAVGLALIASVWTYLDEG